MYDRRLGASTNGDGRKGGVRAHNNAVFLPKRPWGRTASTSKNRMLPKSVGYWGLKWAPSCWAMPSEMPPIKRSPQRPNAADHDRLKGEEQVDATARRRELGRHAVGDTGESDSGEGDGGGHAEDVSIVRATQLRRLLIV